MRPTILHNSFAFISFSSFGMLVVGIRSGYEVLFAFGYLLFALELDHQSNVVVDQTSGHTCKLEMKNGAIQKDCF